MPSTAPSLLAAPTRGDDNSDSDSDLELTSHIHPDLLVQHQNAIHAGAGIVAQNNEGVPDASQLTGANDGTSLESACLWQGCGKLFGRLEELVQHIHKEHVGTSKSSYKCMWEGCQLFGVTRTSRFALIGHIRSHTGERPFTCKLPECDKSFTRSDALTKHMRVVHGIEPLAPNAARETRSAAANTTTGTSGVKGKATGKKRKRGGRNDDSEDDDELGLGLAPSEDEEDAGTEEDAVFGRRKRKGKRGGPVKTEDIAMSLSGRGIGGEMSDDESDYEQLEREVDSMGLVGGVSLAKAKYLVVKAKYRYALSEHERLLERLAFEIEEVKRLKDAKDQALGELVEAQFGSATESLVTVPSKA